MAYRGIERRIHRVYSTQNTKYHVRRDVCVGVQSAKSGDWIHRHAALNRKLACVLKLEGEAPQVEQRPPEVGDVLCFEGPVMTTKVMGIDRPPKDVVETYRY